MFFLQKRFRRDKKWRWLWHILKLFARTFLRSRRHRFRDMTSSQGFVKFVIFVSWLLVTFSFSSAVEVSMKGNSYITYDLRSDSITTEADRITFSFKTIHPFGLFLHSAGSQGDLITIELVHGRIRWVKNKNAWLILS